MDSVVSVFIAAEHYCEHGWRARCPSGTRRLMWQFDTRLGSAAHLIVMTIIFYSWFYKEIILNIQVSRRVCADTISNLEKIDRQCSSRR